MSKPFIAKWSVKLILILFSAAVLFLIGKSFMDGYKEGRQMKLKQTQGK